MNNEKINALGGKVTLGGDVVPAENSINQCRRIIINGVPRRVKVLVTDEIPVRYSERPDVGRDFLTLSFEGEYVDVWKQVSKVSKRVLEYDGRKFTFTGWNSDRNEAFFSAPHKGSEKVATLLDR